MKILLINFAYQALIELVNRDVAFDQYRRGLIDLYAGAWLPAVSAFQSFLEGVAEDEEDADEQVGPGLLGLGQAYIGLGNYSTAITYLDRVITEAPACECVGQAWLDKARAQALMGDTVNARRTYRTFARVRSGDPLAPEALRRSALLALNEDKPSEASSDFLAVADGFPKSEAASLALYVMGIGCISKSCI